MVESLVGRVAELALARERLAGGARVVTLWGPGGIGKTRLAMEVARGFAGEVFFCALAHARTTRELVKVVGQSVGLSGSLARTDAEAVARIGRALGSRDAPLLVFDNVEQVLAPAVAALTTWIAVAPNVRFLVTSREITRVPGESPIELAPLALPSRDDDTSDAVRLLVDRARAVRPDFVAEGRVLRSIVERLDGIPLAIELAAARLTVLRADQLEARLARGFEVLAVDHGGLDARQRTLRGAIDGSWDLLDDDEQRALATASVFRGSFDLDAAEAVLGAGAADVLTSLRHKSLLRAAPAEDAPRFTLLEAIRDYASEKLGEGAAVAEERHAAYFGREALAAADKLDSFDGEAALAWLGREQDNLLVVVERFLARGGATLAEPALRAAIALEPLLTAWGPLSLAADLLEKILPAAVDAPRDLRARAFEARAQALLGLGQLADAHAAAVQGRALGDDGVDAKGGVARARRASLLGAVKQAQGANEDARALHREALAIAEPLGARREIGFALSSLALVDHVDVAPQDAEPLYRRAVEMLAAAGSTRMEARARARLGFLMLDLGRADEAREHFEASLAQTRGKNRALEGIVTGYLGNASRAAGRYAEAGALYEEALARVRAAGDRRFEATFAMDLGVVRVLEGRFAAALDLLGAAESLAIEVGDPRLTGLARGYRAMALAGAQEIAAARALLGATDDAVVKRVRVLQVSFVEACALASASDAARAATRLREQVDSIVAVGLRTDHERVVSGAVQGRLAAIAPSASSIVVDATLGRLRVHGAPWVEVGAGSPNWRVLRALVAARTNAPGVALSAMDLAAAGWPGERLRADVAKNRVRVAVASLRNLGLRDVLLSRAPGYFADPAASIVVLGAI